MDLLNDAAIISINGDEFVGLEGEEFVRTVSSQLNMDANAVQRLYYHYMGGNETLKSSILAVPHILNKGEIIQPWRKGHDKRMQTGIMAAPISIGGVWYLCCVVSIKNAQKKTAPYSIRLFDRSKIEEMIGSNIVHDGTEATSQPSDTSNSNPLTVAKVLQKYLLANYSQENNENDNNNLRTENKQHKTRYNMKKTIRLSESDLHRVIKESVRQCLTELDWRTYVSAAQKRRAQGQHDKAKQLNAHANQTFAQQYGVDGNAEESNGNYTNNIHTGRTRVNDWGGRIGVNQWDKMNGGERYHQKSFGQYQTGDTKENDLVDFDGNNVNDYSKRLRPHDEPRQTRGQRYFPMSNQFKGKLNQMTDDMRNFYNGDSQYVKGKGWQNN